MILCSGILAVLLLRIAVAEELPAISSSDEISRINSLSSDKDDVPPIAIDPRLRRALLRVLTKLEEQDRKKGNHESSRQTAEVMQNIITEEDFIKYFQERGLDKELLNSYDSDYLVKPNEQKNAEEILAYSTDDTRKDTEKPFTFASYPRDKEIDSTPDSVDESKDVVKYPSTFPTPSLGDAIFFQIPEPIHISDSAAQEEGEKGPNNIQETRSIQGPTLVSPTQNGDQTESSGQEENVNFVTAQDPTTIEAVDVNDHEDDVITKVDLLASNGTEIEDVESLGNSSVKAKMEKHEVEFLHAPLLAAFTVQQDQQGLPRRVIPLNYQVSGDPIPLPNIKDLSQDVSKQNVVKDKQKILQEQLEFLQKQQLQEQEYQRLQEFVKQRQRLLDEEAQRQQLIDNQKQQVENEQRLALARQKQQQILFQNQQNNNPQLEFERQRFLQQQNFKNQNIQQQNVQGFQQNVPRQSFNQLNALNQNFQQLNVQQQNFQQQNLQNQNFQQSNVQQQKNVQPNFQQENVQHNFQEQRFNNLQQINQPQDFNFQKSIDFQFQNNVQDSPIISQPLFQPSFNSFGNFQPSVELNRVNRHEPSNQVGNFGQSSPQSGFRFQSSGFQTVQPTQSTFVQPTNFIHSNIHRHRFAPVRNFVAPPAVSLDGQLQSLLSLSGISGDLNGKPNAHEDLNIVSKVLALGHGEEQFARQRQQHFLQQAASTKHELVVEPPSQQSLASVPTPSRVIEPPRP